MVRVMILVLLTTISSLGQAKSDYCQEADNKTQGAIGFIPPLFAEVSGQGRAHFYSAPDEKCKINDLFIIPGDSVVVYTPYDGWFYVIYVNKKTGVDTSGWIKETRLKVTGSFADKP